MTKKLKSLLFACKLNYSSYFPLIISLARQVMLPGYESMSKSRLYNELSQRFNIQRLMRAEQRALKKEDCKYDNKRPLSEDAATILPAEKKTKSSDDKLDPIMLCKITKRKKFEFKRPNGTTAYYNVDSLIDYLITSGEFNDPQTRLSFSDDDLEAIDAKVSHSMLT